MLQDNEAHAPELLKPTNPGFATREATTLQLDGNPCMLQLHATKPVGSNEDSGQPKIKKKKSGMACELYLRKTIGREKKKNYSSCGDNDQTKAKTTAREITCIHQMTR